MRSQKNWILTRGIHEKRANNRKGIGRRAGIHFKLQRWVFKIKSPRIAKGKIIRGKIRLPEVASLWDSWSSGGRRPRLKYQISMSLLNYLGLLWWVVEGKTVYVGKNDSKEWTARVESTFDESIAMMLSLLLRFSEKKSVPQRTICLELHNH